MKKHSDKKVIYAALIGNGLIAVTKFIAAYITRSSAMFSEGVHSVVDTGNQVLLLHGLRQSKKPADERFPFGHGKELYFWSFIVAILIFALGAGISIYEGVQHVLHPNPISTVKIMKPGRRNCCLNSSPNMTRNSVDGPRTGHLLDEYIVE